MKITLPPPKSAFWVEDIDKYFLSLLSPPIYATQMPFLIFPLEKITKVPRAQCKLKSSSSPSPEQNIVALDLG